MCELIVYAFFMTLVLIWDLSLAFMDAGCRLLLCGLKILLVISLKSLIFGGAAVWYLLKWTVKAAIKIAGQSLLLSVFVFRKLTAFITYIRSRITHSLKYMEA